MADNRESIVEHLKEIIHEILSLSLTEENKVFSDSDLVALKLCYIIEKVTSHGLLDRGVFTKTTIWEYLQNLGNSLPGGQVTVDKAKEAKTPIGKARLFIRLSLNEQSLADYLSALIWNENITKKFYHPRALFVSDEYKQTIIMLFENLNKINFRFNLKDENLNDIKLWFLNPDIMKRTTPKPKVETQPVEKLPQTDSEVLQLKQELELHRKQLESDRHESELRKREEIERLEQLMKNQIERERSLREEDQNRLEQIIQSKLEQERKLLEEKLEKEKLEREEENKRILERQLLDIELQKKALEEERLKLLISQQNDQQKNTPPSSPPPKEESVPVISADRTEELDDKSNDSIPAKEEELKEFIDQNEIIVDTNTIEENEIIGEDNSIETDRTDIDNQAIDIKPDDIEEPPRDKDQIIDIKSVDTEEPHTTNLYDHSHIDENIDDHSENEETYISDQTPTDNPPDDATSLYQPQDDTLQDKNDFDSFDFYDNNDNDKEIKIETEKEDEKEYEKETEKEDEDEDEKDAGDYSSYFDDDTDNNNNNNNNNDNREIEVENQKINEEELKESITLPNENLVDADYIDVSDQIGEYDYQTQYNHIQEEPIEIQKEIEAQDLSQDRTTSTVDIANEQEHVEEISVETKVQDKEDNQTNNMNQTQEIPQHKTEKIDVGEANKDEHSAHLDEKNLNQNNSDEGKGGWFAGINLIKEVKNKIDIMIDKDYEKIAITDIYLKIVTRLGDAIKCILREGLNNVLYSDNLAVIELSAAIESVFTHGLIDKNIFRSSTTYWDYLKNLRTTWPMGEEVFTKIMNTPLITSDIGRARCWVRYALNQNRLLDYFNSLSENEEFAKRDYLPKALLRDAEQVQFVKDLILPLSSTRFQLTLSDERLNAPDCWDLLRRDLKKPPPDHSAEHSALPTPSPPTIDDQKSLAASGQDDHAVLAVKSKKSTHRKKKKRKVKHSSLAQEIGEEVIIIEHHHHHHHSRTPDRSDDLSSPSNTNHLPPSEKPQENPNNDVVNALYSDSLFLQQIGVLSPESTSHFDEPSSVLQFFPLSDDTPHQQPPIVETPINEPPKVIEKNIEIIENKAIRDPTSDHREIEKLKPEPIIEQKREIVTDKEEQKGNKEKEYLADLHSLSSTSVSPLVTPENNNTSTTNDKNVIKRNSDFSNYNLYDNSKNIEADMSEIIVEADRDNIFLFMLLLDKNLQVVSDDDDLSSSFELVPDKSPDPTSPTSELFPEGMLVTKYFTKRHKMPQSNCATCNVSLRGASPRFCYYTGKLHCRRCHVNDLSFIPSRIISQWSFSHKPICAKAKKHIGENYSKPVLDVQKLNKSFYQTAGSSFVPVMQYRRVLEKMKEYVYSCRNKERLISSILGEHRAYMLESAHIYSLQDLVNHYSDPKVKLLGFLKDACTQFKSHIEIDCLTCSGKGNYCEICNSKTLIFSYQISQVRRCLECYALYHNQCFEQCVRCPKCVRIERVKSKSKQ